MALDGTRSTHGDSDNLVQVSGRWTSWKDTSISGVTARNTNPCQDDTPLAIQIIIHTFTAPDNSVPGPKELFTALFLSQINAISNPHSTSLKFSP